MSDQSNQRGPTDGEVRGDYKRVALLLAAATVIVFGVFSGNLAVVGAGPLLAVAAFSLLPESTPVPVIPAYTLLAAGAIFLAGLAGLLTHQDVDNTIIGLLWLGAMVVGLLAAVKLDRTVVRAGAGPRSGRAFLRDHVWLIPIILVALALRVHSLETYPPFHGDEGEMGLAALRVLAGEGPPPVATGWLDHPALFHYLQAVPLALFGRNGFALRLPSVLAGLLCLPLVYALGRRWWGPVAGLAAAALLAVSHLHVHFSRLGLNNIESTLFLLLFVFSLTRSRPRRVTVYVLAGLAAGLAQYMYYGSRVILLIAPLLLLLMWRRKTTSPRQLAAFAAGVFLAVLPLLVFYVDRPDTLVNRARSVFVLNQDSVKHVLQSDQATLPEDLLPMLARQLGQNLSFFVADGDRSPFYSAEVPGLDLVTSVLFWLGLGLALTRLPRFPEAVVLLCLGLTVFVGGVLTIDAPNAPRLLIAIPAVALLAGMVVQQGDQLLAAYPRQVKALLLLAILAAATLLNIKIYFGDFQGRLPPGNMGPDLMAREIRAAGDSYQPYLLGQPQLYAEYGTIQFLGGDAVQDLDSVDDIRLPPGKGLLVISLPHRAETLAAVKERWPGGESASYAMDNAEPLYDSYRVRSP